MTEHALTRAHADHQGASHRLCTELGIPLAVRESDVPAMEGGPEYVSSLQHPGLLNLTQKRFWTGPAHPVDRVLRDGDEVGGFAVLDVPDHSVGHVAFWRERDRVLILGDVVNTMNLLHTWELDEIGADVMLDRERRPEQCTIAVRLSEGLSDEQTRRLEQVARACAVHRTLELGIAFEHGVVAADPR